MDETSAFLNITSLKSELESAASQTGVKIHRAYTAEKIPNGEITGFLHPPAQKEEKRVLYPNGTQVMNYTVYDCRLEITGGEINGDFSKTYEKASEIFNILLKSQSFDSVSMSPPSLSKITNRLSCNISFSFVTSSLSDYVAKAGDMTFYGVAVRGFVTSFKNSADVYVPSVTLADGSVYYGTPIDYGRVFELEIKVLPSSTTGFITYVRNHTFTNDYVFLDGNEIRLNKIEKAEILSTNRFETTVRLVFKTP